MKNREDGLIEIYNRIKNKRDYLSLKSFKRTPTRPVTEKYLPCIFMHEGTDTIIKASSRNADGFPCRRVLEVPIEIVVNKGETNIKKLYTEVRSVIFNEGIVVADDNTFIREIRTEGPTGYGLPDVEGITLVLALSYTDKGETIT